MKRLALLLLILLGMTDMAAAKEMNDKNNGMIVRISEIEVFPEYFEDYLTFAMDVAEISVQDEDGVVSIYPMMQIRNKNQIRILEIYKNEDAYKKHIASKHFQTYKQETLHMVKSLDLVDMYQLSPTTFKQIFKKSADKKFD